MLFTGSRRFLLLLLSKEAEKEFTYPGEDNQLDFICAARSSRDNTVTTKSGMLSRTVYFFCTFITSFT
jgi:hypothetical protein